MSREDQDAQVAKQAKEQIEYCANAWAGLSNNQINELCRRNYEMARPKGTPNKPKVPKVSEALIEAMSFISVAATKDVQPYQQHCYFKDGFLTISDGQVSAGYPFEMDITVAPNYKLFLKAINKTGNSLVVSQLANNTIAIKGDKIRAVVPCLIMEEIPTIKPDTPQVVIDNPDLKSALELSSVLVNENGQRMIECAVLLEPNTCSGTDGKAMIQIWHGFSNLPPRMAIPAIFAKGIAKTKQKITAFGADGHIGDQGQWIGSVTFFFEGGMWLKTLVYADAYPDINPILNVESFPKAIPDGLLEAVDAVDDFNDGECILINNMVKSHPSEDVGAQYDVDGVEGNKRFKAEYLKKLLPLATTADVTSKPDRMFFFGNNIRGVIMAISGAIN